MPLLQIFALCVVLKEDESKLVVLLFGTNEGCQYMNSILNYSIGEFYFLNQILAYYNPYRTKKP